MAKYLIMAALFMLLIAIISIKRQEQSVTVSSIELKDLVYEAKIAREDLEALLQNVQVASEEAVKSLDDAITTRYEQFTQTIETAEKKTSSSPPPPPFSLDDMRKAHPYIMAPRLQEMGYSIVQIAEYLARSTGEIELILSLAAKKQKIS